MTEPMEQKWEESDSAQWPGIVSEDGSEIPLSYGSMPRFIADHNFALMWEEIVEHLEYFRDGTYNKETHKVLTDLLARVKETDCDHTEG